MEIFFDIGKKGGYAIFHRKKLKKYGFYNLSSKKTIPAKEKIYRFKNFLKSNFTKTKKYQYLATYEPFGSNIKTTMNLSFLIVLLIEHFCESTPILLNEWEMLKDTLNINKIPSRWEKKKQIIIWVEKKFKLKNLTDDEAEAIIGGYYLSKNFIYQK